MSRYDVAIIGGGIVGLATAYRLLETRPGLALVVLEKEPALAMHQTGHNSGVVHSGLYYKPGSLKAQLCRDGAAQLAVFCERRGIPLVRTGKLVVAATEAELPRLQALHERGLANGVPGLERVGRERMREIEPHAVGLAALWSPTTGVVDFRAVALALAHEIREHGGEIRTSWEVCGIDDRSEGLVLTSLHGELMAKALIGCAGLWADRVAALSGGTTDSPRIVPFRGDYYTLKPDSAALVRGLIYPVPDPRFPFLGVHFTRRADGEVWAGPNAVLAFSRTGYRRRDVSLRDARDTLTYPGFLRLGRRYVRTGLGEQWRDVSKRAFVRALQRYVPAIRSEQLVFGPSGVRAQALTREGTLVDDFDLAVSRRAIHVRNAPSPAATASLAIGEYLATEAVRHFEL